ncbi:HtaA domain-containing protein [Dietzia sp. SYD-A1]|uniref:HtaA domain-containing protein n=1 Tax=Dietzia sp. SYD-A1 TaxID=2780141 RepID=UPI0018916B29|nr:HtaA domain-containing protein [Dietzia sp. SYD-A1]
MTSDQLSGHRRGAALVLALALALGSLMYSPAARAQDSAVELTDAEFRWGLSRQSAGPSHGPGLNFLSAGDSSAALAGPGATITEQTWRATSGQVTIEKRSANGGTSTATWAGTQTDQAGTALRDAASSRYSGLEMVFGKGTGTVDAASGTAEIQWKGTASVLYYSGLVFLSVTDPVLTVTPTKATVTATLGGRRSAQDNPEVSTPVPSRIVVLANLPRSRVELGGKKGFSVTPEYLGVPYSAGAGENPQTRDGAYWGAFPREFVDFAAEAGSGGFWYSTGTSDSTKPALPIAVSWNSDEPEEMPNSGGSGGSGGIVGRVLDDTVEQILRAAGTDVADTAAAWMDEAWKPLQPDAVNAARDSAGPAAAAPDASAAEGGGVDEVFEEYFADYYTAGAPLTAGTVGGTVATIPASPSGPSSGGSSPAATPPLVDQSTIPVAANTPLNGSDVVYAQTSGSQKAGNPTHQWQWWVGTALLALAAVLFYQTVRRKD